MNILPNFDIELNLAACLKLLLVFRYSSIDLYPGEECLLLLSFVIPAGLFVISAGFEPTTRSLEGCCSIQLSYETNWTANVGGN